MGERSHKDKVPDPEAIRARELVNDAAGAITRLIWKLGEAGACPGSPREKKMTAEEAETREKLQALQKKLDDYFGYELERSLERVVREHEARKG